jgi:hypothetical protein
MYSYLNNKKTTSAVADNTIYSKNLKNPQEFHPLPYSQESLESRLKKSSLYRISRPSDDPQSAIAEAEVVADIKNQ